ncbi:MAG: DMT family transporter [Burkholderiaceae bacterium]|nr:MAG: DMT family transporter [Burkholderiaceae bacterium]
MSASPAASRALPALALVFNAFIWGMSWLPFRALQGHGLHPLWATVIAYGLPALLLLGLRGPSLLRTVLASPALWLIAFASGATNVAFNWGVTEGQVVRVVLLFYLMPVWAMLLARVVLGERIDAQGLLRLALALAGALVVLLPAGGGLPVPSSLPDWLGVVGGMAFALNNVMLRREAARGEDERALAMLLGGSLLASMVGTCLWQAAVIPAPTALPAMGWLVAMGLALGFGLANLALQYGAARLPAQIASLVMLTELVFASLGAHFLGGEPLTSQTLAGGGLIVLAALVACLKKSG